MRRTIAAVVVLSLVFAACGDDDDVGPDNTGASTSSAPTTSTTTTTTPPPTIPVGECKIGPTSNQVPTIGETGTAAIETGLVPEGIGGRVIGFELRQMVDFGELCADDLVRMHGGEVTPALEAAIEMAVAKIQQEMEEGS
jgi:hypothetical protein